MQPSHIFIQILHPVPLGACERQGFVAHKLLVSCKLSLGFMVSGLSKLQIYYRLARLQDIHEAVIQLEARRLDE